MQSFPSKLRPPPRARALYTGAGPSLLPHGGKRTRAAVSIGLSAAHVASIINAAIGSIERDMPFNRFVTVHWGALGLSDAQAFKATSALTKYARDLLRDNGAVGIWAWVRENDDGDGAKGSHVHWLVHVPEKLREAFLGRLKGWCVRAAGASRYRAGALSSSPIGRHVDSWLTSPDSHHANLREVVAYVLKGLSPQAAHMVAKRLDLIWIGYGAAMPNPGTAGIIQGKRVGVSKSLRG
jgi:hypothetical protein